MTMRSTVSLAIFPMATVAVMMRIRIHWICGMWYGNKSCVVGLRSRQSACASYFVVDFIATETLVSVVNNEFSSMLVKAFYDVIIFNRKLTSVRA